MEGSLKIDFEDDDSFTVFYITTDIFNTEDEYKILFNYINDVLYKRYNYLLHGFYDVVIHFYKGIYVLDFELIDDYGRKDFNVTVFLNTDMLYEFEDIFLMDKEKIYYNDHFYVELDSMISNIKLFEYGRIVYGTEVNDILDNGILIN